MAQTPRDPQIASGPSKASRAVEIVSVDDRGVDLL